VERFEWQRRWASDLASHGWAGPAWPREWGGMGLPLSDQVAYHEEMAHARLPGHPSSSVNIIGPTLIRHGTDEQRRRFLTPMLAADEIWCQGFSEPDAGSDLPSLTTRATRADDIYILTGHKVWTTNAMRADWMFALVRTGDQQARERGLTYLLVDMHAPGVEVRRLRDITGGYHFGEVFLTDVAVPATRRVGDEGDGWRIARTSLGLERSTAFVGNTIRYQRIMGELCDLAVTTGRSRDPILRQRLARLETMARLGAINGSRTVEHALRHGEVGPTSSVTRLLHSLLEQEIHEVAMDVIGAAGMLGRQDPGAVQGGRWVWGFLQTRASTIGAGTSEIQRNTIAEQVLGLPHEPATQKGAG